MDQTYSLKKFLKSPFSLTSLPFLIFVFSGLGFLDAAYLSIDHYRNISPPCTIHGCEVVLHSQYATIGMVPIALIGVLYYLVVLVLGGIFVQTKKKIILLSLLILSSLSLFVSAYLVCIQAFVIHSFCQYCLFSELMNFLLFDTLWWLWNSKNHT